MINSSNTIKSNCTVTTEYIRGCPIETKTSLTPQGKKRTRATKVGHTKRRPYHDSQKPTVYYRIQLHAESNLKIRSVSEIISFPIIVTLILNQSTIYYCYFVPTSGHSRTSILLFLPAATAALLSLAAIAARLPSHDRESSPRPLLPQDDPRSDVSERHEDRRDNVCQDRGRKEGRI